MQCYGNVLRFPRFRQAIVDTLRSAYTTKVFLSGFVVDSKKLNFREN